MKYSTRYFLFCLLLATCVCATHVSAAATITMSDPVVAKNTDETQYINIKYSLKDVPVDGAIIVLKVQCEPVNPSIPIFDPKPLSSELSGDIGTVVGDGSKVIKWDAEKTLVRLGKQDKYHCTFSLAIQGDANSISGATLNIASYTKSGWYYFTTGLVHMLVEKRTGNTPEFACAEIGTKWSTVAMAAGATFYKISSVPTFPVYKGRNSADPFRGVMTDPGCSSFIGIKDYGKPSQIVWANFTKRFRMSQGRVTADYEFDFRVVDDKGAGKATLSVGNCGKVDQQIFSELNTGDQFDFSLDVGKVGEKVSNPVDIEIPRYEWKYFYKGKHILTFKVPNKKSSFQGANAKSNTLELKDGTEVMIGSALTFTGSSFSIDTSTDAASITYNGAIYANGFPICTPFETGTFGTITLNDSLVFGTWPALTDVVGAVCGFGLGIERMRTTGDPNNPDGVLFDVRFRINMLQEGCESLLNVPVLVNSRTGGILIRDIGISSDGHWQWPVAVQANNFGIKSANEWCLKNFSFSYDKAADKMAVDLLCKSSMWSDIGGGFTLLKGSLDAFKITAKLDKGGIPVPFPEPPVAEWRGLEVEITNISQGPLSYRGTAFFGNVAGWKNLPYYDQIVAKLPALDWQIFELEGSILGNSLGEVSIDGKARFFGKADIWVAQVTGTVGMAFNLKDRIMGMSLNSSISMVQLGGNQWFYTGQVKGSVNILPSFVISASERGDLYIPDLFKNHPFFQMINSKLALPRRLTSVQVLWRNTQLAFDMDLGWLGSWGMWVDVSRNPITETRQFIGIQRGTVQNLASRTWHDKSNGIQSDTTYVPFSINNARYAYAQIIGDPQPSTFLVSPSGSIIKSTQPDSSIIFSPAASSDDFGLWVLKAPQKGNWKLGVVGRTSNDSIAVWATLNTRPAFTMSTTSIGKTIYCTWDPKGASDSSNIYVFLDSDNKGYDGYLVAVVPEKAGTFSYTLADTLPGCSYYVYANRWDGDIASDFVYSASAFDNSKTRLAAPKNLRAVCNLKNVVSLQWDHNSDTAAVFYRIIATDAVHHDSTIATVLAGKDGVDFVLANAPMYKYSIQTFGSQDVRGCPTAFSDIVLDVEKADEPIVTGDAALYVVPSPSNLNTHVHYRSQASNLADLTLCNTLGQIVFTHSQWSVHEGMNELVLDTSSLPSGSYTLRLSDGSCHRTLMLMVVH